MLVLKMRISLEKKKKKKNLPIRLHSLDWEVGSPPLLVRDFFLPSELAAVKISPWKREAEAAASAGSDSHCLPLVSRGGRDSDSGFPLHSSLSPTLLEALDIFSPRLLLCPGAEALR